MFLYNFINTFGNEGYKLIDRINIGMCHEQYIFKNENYKATIDDEYHKGIQTITIVIKNRLGGKDEH